MATNWIDQIWMIYPNVITTSTTSTTLPGMEIAPHPPRAVYLFKRQSEDQIIDLLARICVNRSNPRIRW